MEQGTENAAAIAGRIERRRTRRADRLPAQPAVHRPQLRDIPLVLRIKGEALCLRLDVAVLRQRIDAVLHVAGALATGAALGLPARAELMPVADRLRILAALAEA